MTTTRLALHDLLPGHPATNDVCIERLMALLGAERGVERAHLDTSNGRPEVCVHYDAGHLPLPRVQEAARTAGADVRTRYRHERFDLAGLHCADCATSIETVTGRLDGVRAASATYATETLNVTYDTHLVDRVRIVRAVEGLGYRVRDEASARPEVVRVAEDGRPRRGPWLGGRRELTLSLLAGAALALAWLGETFLGLPAPVALALYVVAYVSGGGDATRHAIRAGLKGRFDIDVLMVVAALGAAALGEFAEGALLLFLFSLGHALEHHAMDRARGAIRALADLAPKTARVRREGREREIPVGELLVGDTVVVRAGERLPADGRVVAGASAVDQAPITGESLPIAKEAGDDVFAGTINGDGALEIETTKGPEDTTLARVIAAVENAQSAKAPSHRFTDRFQRTFTPVILIVTVLVIAVPPLFGAPFGESFIRAMILLVAASPCALALATPSAVLAGIARAARSGVLIKGGAHLENAGSADVVVFDKTGTLTRGEPTVTDVWSGAGVSEGELLRSAAAIETRSGHPLAKAVVAAAEARDQRLPEVEAFEAVKGKGVRARIDGAAWLVGNVKLMHDAGLTLPTDLEVRHAALERDGKTSMLVARDAQVLGLIAVRDEPRANAAATIAALKGQGVKRIVMLTGDNRRVAEALGRELGLDEVGAELLPEDKAARVEALRKRYGKVIMVGDGVNDAPAMAAADVAVAMGGAGTDVALETADIALMADDLAKLPYAIALSRASRRMIVQNLIISLGVIGLLVPSALLGLASIGVAIVLHESSTLVVVANALRLLGYRTRGATA